MIGNYVVTALLLLLAPAGARAGAPAAPWDQHGTAYVQLVDVPLDVAERCVSMPDVFDVVPYCPEVVVVCRSSAALQCAAGSTGT